jgi:hypothetical protein
MARMQRYLDFWSDFSAWVRNLECHFLDHLSFRIPLNLDVDASAFTSFSFSAKVNSQFILHLLEIYLGYCSAMAFRKECCLHNHWSGDNHYYHQHSFFFRASRSYLYFLDNLLLQEA